jgi:hypothetical protein
MKGVKHYKKNGTEYKGKTHKMLGEVHTGAKHTSTSVKLFHKKELSKAIQKKLGA